jgi:hypothetical protein
MISEIQEQQNQKEAIHLKHIHRHHKLPALITSMSRDISSITYIKGNEELEKLHRRDKWLYWREEFA